MLRLQFQIFVFFYDYKRKVEEKKINDKDQECFIAINNNNSRRNNTYKHKR